MIRVTHMQRSKFIFTQTVDTVSFAVTPTCFKVYSVHFQPLDISAIFYQSLYDIMFKQCILIQVVQEPTWKHCINLLVLLSWSSCAISVWTGWKAIFLVECKSWC